MRTATLYETQNSHYKLVSMDNTFLLYSRDRDPKVLAWKGPYIVGSHSYDLQEGRALFNITKDVRNGDMSDRSIHTGLVRNVKFLSPEQEIALDDEAAIKVMDLEKDMKKNAMGVTVRAHREGIALDTLSDEESSFSFDG